MPLILVVNSCSTAPLPCKSYIMGSMKWQLKGRSLIVHCYESTWSIECIHKQRISIFDPQGRTQEVICVIANNSSNNLLWPSLLCVLLGSWEELLGEMISFQLIRMNRMNNWMCKIMEGIGRNNEVERERVLHLKTSMQETELNHYDPGPPPKAIVKEESRLRYHCIFL